MANSAPISITVPTTTSAALGPTADVSSLGSQNRLLIYLGPGLIKLWSTIDGTNFAPVLQPSGTSQVPVTLGAQNRYALLLNDRSLGFAVERLSGSGAGVLAVVGELQTSGPPTTIQQTFTSDDLTAVALAETLDYGAPVPAGSMILGVDVALVTPFSGGGATAVVMALGSAGDPDAVLTAVNLFAAAVDGKASDHPLGIAPNKLFPATTQLQLRFTSDVTVDLLTAGTVIVTTAVLPP